MIHRLLLTLPPETAHDVAIAGMRALQPLVKPRTVDVEPRHLWGMTFRNPLGIAAGFDKNAVVIPFLQSLGFGFVEVGTVTLRAQKGNPKPRIFRFRRERALINRLGFNNDGAHAMAKRLAVLRHRYVPVFVNIGKGRDVPIEDAEDNYRSCYRIVAPVADAVVVNVSSPNTPGLRDLQEPEQLERVLNAFREVRDALGVAQPILVKIAPDLSPTQLRDVAHLCLKSADGIIATNTTVSRPGGVGTEEKGGLSGAPLFDLSTLILRHLRSIVGKSYPLVGVGGIMSPADARAKLDAGADLIQIYTGLVYGGPRFPRAILKALA